jgi:MFS family permease
MLTENKPELAKTETSAVMPLKIPDFRYLWIGTSLINLGVQFYAVALVWLVLYLTNSGVALGTILTIAAVPRAVAMLLSGALIDRVSPRRVLALSALAKFALTATVTLLLLGNLTNLVLIGAIAGLLGIVDSVIYPASGALTMRLVDKSQLAPANSLMQGSESIANIVGPAAGGVLVGVIGLPATFALNSIIFLIGCLLVWAMRSAKSNHVAPEAAAEPLGKSLLNGFRYGWSRIPIRLSLLVVAMLNFAGLGPVIVGGAILVERRLDGDATMFGILTAAYGVGALVGTIIAGFMGRMKRPGLSLVVLSAWMGVGLIAFGFAPNFWWAFGALAVQGMGVGLGGVFAITWMQSHTEERFAGRITSLLVFFAVATDPFSNAVSGFVAEINLLALYLGAGGLLLATAVVILCNKAAWETES